jgi:hypothetical protein
MKLRLKSIKAMRTWLVQEQERLKERYSKSKDLNERISLDGSIITIKKLRGMI